MRVLRKNVARLLSILMGFTAVGESAPTSRADTSTTEPNPYSGRLQFGPAAKEPIESSFEHSEREDYSRNGWGDARQTVPFAVTGAISYNFSIPIEIVAPNTNDLRRAEKILAALVRRWQ